MLLSRRNPTIENRQPANHPPITHLRFYTASTGSGRASGQWALDGNTSEAQPPPTATPPTSNNVQVEQNDIKCSAFIAEKCKGSIMREFPGEYLDLSVDQLLKDAQGGVQAAKMGKTLLFDNRIRK